MKVESKEVKLPNVGDFTTEYIEQELTKLHINPLRWAIIGVSDKITIGVADLIELEG